MVEYSGSVYQKNCWKNQRKRSLQKKYQNHESLINLPKIMFGDNLSLKQQKASMRRLIVKSLKLFMNQGLPGVILLVGGAVKGEQSEFIEGEARDP